MRAALYARFSSAELQSPKSITDQLHECRRCAEKLGATVVAEFTDAGISAAAMVNRPGVLDLLAAARTGAFDVVIADELSRLTRDGGHAWDIFYDLEALGIAIETATQGQADELKIGLLGTVSALERKQTGARVRRGLSGVVRAGRFPSRPPYGYRLKIAHDERGERIRGLIEIDEAQAAVVRRAVGEILGGSTAHQVTMRLNAEGVPAPNGGAWEVSAIAGARNTLRGLCRNPLYAGEIVWNRTAQPKDRRTGKVRRRVNVAADHVRHDAPELAIVDRATWAALQAELSRRSENARSAGTPAAANAGKRLFSGLVHCGLCGGAMHTMGPGRKYRCLGRARKGPVACANSTGADPDAVEALALEQVRADLLHPEVVEAAVRELHRAQASRSTVAAARRPKAEAQLAQVKREAARLIALAVDLGASATLKEKLAEAEARRAQLEAELADMVDSAEVVRLHPRAAERYRALVEDLAARLAPAAAGNAEPAAKEAARAALRKVVTAVRITPAVTAPAGELSRPTNRAAAWTLRLEGNLSRLLVASAIERKAAQQ